MDVSFDEIRQAELNKIVAEALTDDDLLEALGAFEMGQAEYQRAIRAGEVVQIISGNTTQPVIA